MTTGYLGKRGLVIAVSIFLFLGLFAGVAVPQDRLPSMPGYAQYQKMSQEMRTAVKSGALNVTWKEDSKSFTYTRDGKTFQYDVSKRKATEVEGAAVTPADQPFGRPGRQGRRPVGTGERVERGRQYTWAPSPNGKLKAFYRNRNFWLSDSNGTNERAITTEGNEKDRTKYGSANWTYGEELGQTTAMWWSPDSKMIAYYRFDESAIKDYYVTHNHLRLQDSVEIEPYMKVGAPNPIVDIFVYHVDSKKKVQLDVRSGKPFTTDVLGHYVYDVSWSPDGKEFFFHRTNRKQNIMEWMAANPATGTCRVIVHEEWLPSFTENSPFMQFLKDNNRFIWESQRTGWRNYYLYDLSGKLHAQLTNLQAEIVNIVRVDEEAGYLYYMARDGENHMKVQLHRVGLNGKGDIRLTDPAFNHRVSVSPDGKHFVDIAQTHDLPPATRLLDSKGKMVAELATSDLSRFDSLGLKKVELLKFKAADGKTELHGLLHFPSNFDPSKKYPLLIFIYGGPATNHANENFSAPNATTEYGFLYAQFDARTAAQKGKKLLDLCYGHLGQVEIDDLAEGVKSLWNRPYLNKERVGIFGTSYGGTSSATCLLKYPDVFYAACANSGVYDFRNYDNIYTERFMGLLDENLAGYEGSNTMQYAKNLKGRLMIYFGTADNNVHPANSLQLIAALQRERKNFEVQVGPDQGHTAVNNARMMEFFIENLIMK